MATKTRTLFSRLRTRHYKQLASYRYFIDKNNDGKLSREELIEAYEKTHSIEDAAKEVDKVMK